MDTLISESSRRYQFEYLIYRLNPEEDQQALLRGEIEEFAPDIVAGAGGDGTINLLASLLQDTGIPLLIIPLGSANGMAKELGIVGRIEYAMSLIEKGVNRRIDLLRINGKICVHLADVGLNARVVKRFDQDPRRGILTYARHLFNEIFLIKKYRFRIHSDGKEFVRKAVSMTFANASKYGTGAVINPLGKVDDGRFELVIIKPFPRIKLLSIAWKMFMSKLQTSEYVEVISCKEATIRSSKKTTLQIDGEVIGKFQEIDIKILPGALSVIVPENP